MPKIKVGITRKRFSRKEFNKFVACQLYYEDFQYVKTAYELAKYGHLGQKRLDGTRYFEHAKSVALIIMLECGVYLRNPIVVGLMHDLREDSYILSWWAVEVFFGKDVYRGLREITKEEGKDYYERLNNLPKKDWWVQLVKLADILHNFRTMVKTSKTFRTRQLEEKCTAYPPLLNALAKNIPRDRRHIVDYLRKELDHASDLVRISLETKRVNKKDPSD